MRTRFISGVRRKPRRIPNQGVPPGSGVHIPQINPVFRMPARPYSTVPRLREHPLTVPALLLSGHSHRYFIERADQFAVPFEQVKYVTGVFPCVNVSVDHVHEESPRTRASKRR